MFAHNPAVRDNVLVEWILSLECIAAGKVEKIFPILIGKVDADCNIGNFFENVKFNDLPNIVPTATIK